MTDFRALCAELLLALEGEGYTHWTHSPDEDDLVLRARAALARWGTPNLAETGSSLVDAPQPLAEDRELAPVAKQPTVMQLIELSEEIEADGLGQVDFARAVLARWGNPAPQHNPWKDTLLDALVCNFLLNAENEDNPKKALNDLIAWEKKLATDPLINPELQPVPISERLPEPKDCDAEGRCWWWHPSHAESGYWEGWMLRPRAWGVGRYDFDDRLVHTHWLPAHALPLPDTND